MRVAVAGGTGFLGRSLVSTLRADGHVVTTLTRGPTVHPNDATWRPDGSVGDWIRVLDGADAIVNLAGASIGARRWTTAEKQRIRDSRILATRSLSQAIARVRQPPRVFLSGSGVGYYGSRGDEIITEDSGPGSDFLSDVCRAWEAEAVAAEQAGTRVAIMRTAPVFGSGGGILEQIARPFNLFVGGPIGSGRQYMPWIHLEDWIALARFLLNGDQRGAFNATAPSPVRNTELTRELAQALRRPAVMRAPAFALKLLLGEAADALALSSQRVVPARALAAGFRFKYPGLHEALRQIYEIED